jgi:hypothetical protein
MFNYVDPVGGNILAAQGALINYRELVDSFYMRAANIIGTKFQKLESFSLVTSIASVSWPAFPLTAGASYLLIDQRRWELQDEYVEWQVVRDVSGQVTKITFTTELPEYYVALAEISETALVAGIKDAIPGAAPTTDDLFGPGFNPTVASPEERGERFRDQSLDQPSANRPPRKPPNPWTNGDKGILCLLQRFNSTGALFNLLGRCGVPNPDPGIPAASQCSVVGSFCGPARNSDPRICQAAQTASRVPLGISLADAPGINIDRLLGTWRINGVQIDVNDPTQNQGIWTVDRNGRRGTLRISPDVTLDGDSVDFGAQVSRVLEVSAKVVTASVGNISPMAAGQMPVRGGVQLKSRSVQ